MAGPKLIRVEFHFVLHYVPHIAFPPVFIGKVYLDWPVVGWGFVLFWVSFMRCPLVRTIVSLLHPTTC